MKLQVAKSGPAFDHFIMKSNYRPLSEGVCYLCIVFLFSLESLTHVVNALSITSCFVVALTSVSVN